MELYMFFSKPASNGARNASVLRTLLGGSNRSPTLPFSIAFEKIARGFAGKTMLDLAINETVTNLALPSGLQFDVGTPLDVASLIKKDRAEMRQITTDAAPPTMNNDMREYALTRGGQKLLQVTTREVIGQILEHTTNQSPPEQITKQKEYVSRLAKASCLWAMVPCVPAEDAGRHRSRFRNDLRIVRSYLTTALAARPTGQKIAVALIVPKLDIRFATATQAREQLPDDVLRRDLATLVNTVRHSEVISSAAIFPLSSFGFGVAQIKPGSVTPERHAAAEDAEDIWILREECDIDPFNVAPLVVWSMLHALISNDVIEGQEGGFDELVRQLEADLKSLDGWIVPIKGHA
jgi:hypothetical protein